MPSHPGVLGNLLDALAGSVALSDEARTWLMLDPGLALAVLRLTARPGMASSRYSFAELCGQISFATLKSLVSDAALHLLDQPETAIAEGDWMRAISLAHLCRSLALHTAYPARDEAWLAGLLGALPDSQAVLAALPLRGFLADVPVFLQQPASRLIDATALPRLAACAWRLQENPEAGEGDALSLPAPANPEALRAILEERDRSVEALSTLASAHQNLAAAVTRFTRAELATLGMHERTTDAIEAAARMLAEQPGLLDPVYLRLDTRTSLLEAQNLGEWPVQPLSIRVEGSNSAAVRALFTRLPVVVYTDTDDEAALIDIQLARQARADGVAAIPVGSGATRGILLVCGDHEALAEIAAHRERYSRLGELAGQITAPVEAAADNGDSRLGGRVRRAAHEINNPLGIIKNYLAILKAKLGDAAPIADELRIIHEELDRIVRIVRTLAHGDDNLAELPEASDIALLAADLVKVTAPTWQPRGIQVTHHTSPGLPRLTCDRDKLKQILLNLLLNALEATPDGGTVRLETAQVTNHKRERFIEMQISDSGPGIPADLAEQLFDPVASEKGGNHAGLGLAIVKSLTEDLNGSLAFKTSASGTTFQLQFRLG
jgi:hypothetical protein